MRKLWPFFRATFPAGSAVLAKSRLRRYSVRLPVVLAIDQADFLAALRAGVLRGCDFAAVRDAVRPFPRERAAGAAAFPVLFDRPSRLCFRAAIKSMTLSPFGRSSSSASTFG